VVQAGPTQRSDSGPGPGGGTGQVQGH
jgi:hypothetical protein